MLSKAFERIPDGTNLILHSDQGWHYQHRQYQRMLRRKGIRQSMSRKGNCLDATKTSKGWKSSPARPLNIIPPKSTSFVADL